MNINEQNIEKNSMNTDLEEKNKKIIKMNTNLYHLDEDNKILNSKEKKLKDELEKYNEAYKDENKKSKLCFKLFIASLALIAINSFRISNGTFVLPSEIVPRIGLSGLSFAISITTWLHFTSIADSILFKIFDKEAELSKIHSYQKEISEVKALVNEKLHSQDGQQYLDEINETLDEKAYLNEIITSSFTDKPKTRTLKNNTTKH